MTDATVRQVADEAEHQEAPHVLADLAFRCLAACLVRIDRLICFYKTTDHPFKTTKRAIKLHSLKNSNNDRTNRSMHGLSLGQK